MSNNKSITATNIPRALLEKKLAKEHFSQFGKIKKFILNPKRSSCVIEFDTPIAAQSALQYGYIYDEDEFEVAYTAEESAKIDVPDFEERFPMKRELLHAIGGVNNQRSFVKQAPVRSITDVDRRNATPLEIINVPVNVRNEFEAIMKKPAFTAEERFRVLDARDKLLRLTMEKNTDLKAAKRTVGVCPDMCPEKERVMREFQHQVSIFEVDSNRGREAMNHHTALKQYSRSSADQESPLANELRPEPVLQRTMVYLMREIIDLCDDSTTNISDWFHFVWDRMRSIRKDITQQDLCSVGAVELVEQCARFHIHCAGRLIAEDISVFDQKINTENLTKCLQSLKYMYHDLSLKGVDCPNEAEFRGYIVLLNMNDSNFLWEIKQLRSRIQKSKDIRFAIAVYLAMDSNNYVKFFNLVRETNYLNACILMRYFMQIRTKSLYVIFKSYTPRTPIQFPLQHFVDVLGFDDFEEVVQFCEHHGLACDQDFVLLDRKFFFTPDFPFKMERAFNLVESKRTVSAGEAVCGKIIPLYESFGPYVPHDSFDAHGLLKAAAWRAEDQNYYKQKDSGIFLSPLPSPRLLSPKIPSPTRVSPKLIPPAKSSATFSLPTSLISPKSSWSGPTSFKIDSLNVFKPVKPVKSTASPSFSFSFATGSSEMGKSNENSTSFVVPKKKDEEPDFENEDYIDDEDDEQEDKYEEEYDEEDITENSDDGQKSYYNDDDDDDDDDDEDYDEKDEVDEPISMPSVKSQKQMLKSESEILVEASKFLDRLIASVVAEEVLHMAENEMLHNENIFRQAKKTTDEHLKFYINQIVTQIAQDELIIEYIKRYRYFMRWQKIVKQRIAKRQALESIPVWIPAKQITCNDIGIDPTKILFSNKSPLQIKVHKNKKLKINFAKVVKHIDTFNCTKSQIYWKVLVSLPDETEATYFYSFAKKLFASFEIFHREFYSNKMYNICVRRAIGCQLNDENEQEDYRIGEQINGLVFMLTDHDLGLSRRRLQNIIAHCNIPAPFPVSIITCNSQIDAATIIDCLELQYYLDENLIKFNEENIQHVKYVNNNPEPLQQSLEIAFTSLGKRHDLDYIYALELQNTVTFMDVILGDELWKRINTLVDTNTMLLMETQNINFVISLYNNILFSDKLKAVLTHDLKCYASLPSEFRDKISDCIQSIPLTYEHYPADFNSIDRQNTLEDFIATLKLPYFKFNCKLPDESASFNIELQAYLRSLFPTEPLRSQIYYKCIQYVQRIFEHNLSAYSESSKLVLSWVEVIKIISVNNLHYQLETAKNLPAEIVYNKSEFNFFINTYVNEACDNSLNSQTSSPVLKRKKL